MSWAGSNSLSSAQLTSTITSGPFPLGFSIGILNLFKSWDADEWCKRNRTNSSPLQMALSDYTKLQFSFCDTTYAVLKRASQQVVQRSFFVNSDIEILQRSSIHSERTSVHKQQQDSWRSTNEHSAQCNKKVEYQILKQASALAVNLLDNSETHRLKRYTVLTPPDRPE
jgi:hypothetical protein